MGNCLHLLQSDVIVETVDSQEKILNISEYISSGRNVVFSFLSFFVLSFFHFHCKSF